MKVYVVVEGWDNDIRGVYAVKADADAAAEAFFTPDSAPGLVLEHELIDSRTPSEYTGYQLLPERA